MDQQLSSGMKKDSVGVPFEIEVQRAVQRQDPIAGGQTHG